MCRYKTGRTRTNNSERRRPSPQLPTPDYVTIPTRLMSYHYCPLDASYTCRTDNTTALTKKQTVSLKRLPMLPTLLYCFTLHLSLDRHDDFQRSKDDSFHMNRYYYSWLTVTACRWIYLGTIRYIGQQWSRYLLSANCVCVTDELFRYLLPIWSMWSCQCNSILFRVASAILGKTEAIFVSCDTWSMTGQNQ